NYVLTTLTFNPLPSKRGRGSYWRDGIVLRFRPHSHPSPRATRAGRGELRACKYLRNYNHFVANLLKKPSSSSLLTNLRSTKSTGFLVLIVRRWSARKSRMNFTPSSEVLRF